MKNPFLLIAIILAAISAYMFLALRFKALLFIFRLRPGLANIADVSQGANQALSHRLGMVLAPIIGIVTLCGAVYSASLWRTENRHEAERPIREQAEAQKRLSEVSSVLNKGEIVGIYRGEGRRHVDAVFPDDQGREEIVDFVRSVGGQLSVGDIVSNSEGWLTEDQKAAIWTVDFIGGPWKPARPGTILLNSSMGLIVFKDSYSIKNLVPSAFRKLIIEIPESLKERFNALEDITPKEG